MFTNSTVGGGNTVAYSQQLQRWVVGGRSSTRCNWLYSNDGITYFGSGTAPPCSSSFGNCHGFFTSVHGIHWSHAQALFVGVGSYNTATIVTSTDGITCTARTPASGATNTMYDVAFSPTQSRWIVAGTDPTFSLQYSMNGITWTGILGSSALMNPIYGIAWSETLQHWVAVGLKNAGTYIARSTTGTTFTAITGPSGGNIINKQGMQVVYGGFIGWGLAGAGTVNTLAYSSDGVDFDNGLGASNFANTATGIAYSVEKQLWVAIGDGGLAVSVNGITWNSIYSTLNNPYFGGPSFSIGSFPTFGGVGVAYCNNTRLL
jgi:hypothetical protein